MRKSKADKLKNIRKQIKDTSIELETEQTIVAKKNNNILRLKSKFDSLKTQLSKLELHEEKSVTISDHALLRYVERVCDVDVDSIRKQLIDKLNPMFETLGDGTYHIKDNLKIIIRNGNAVTVIDKTVKVDDK